MKLFRRLLGDDYQKSMFLGALGFALALASMGILAIALALRALNILSRTGIEVEVGIAVTVTVVGCLFAWRSHVLIKRVKTNFKDVGRILGSFIVMFLLVGCAGPYTLVTSDVKQIAFSGSIRIASLTVRNNTEYTVMIDSYPYSVEMQPANEIEPGGVIRLSFRTFLRSDRSYRMTVLATVKGLQNRNGHMVAIGGDTHEWYFNDSYYYGSQDVAWLVESAGERIYFR